MSCISNSSLEPPFIELLSMLTWRYSSRLEPLQSPKRCWCGCNFYLIYNVVHGLRSTGSPSVAWNLVKFDLDWLFQIFRSRYLWLSISCLLSLGLQGRPASHSDSLKPPNSIIWSLSLASRLDSLLVI